MEKKITNSPKEIIPIVQSIIDYIEDNNNVLNLEGFERFEDLGEV